MAEDAVLRETSADGLLEGIDIVDPLADVRALSEKVLIHIGNGPSIRIDARLGGEKPGEPRLTSAGQTHAHARLENAVAFDDASELRIETRTIQRMGHRADQLTCRVARQLRISVERNDEFDAGKDFAAADDHTESVFRSPAQ